ncbi:MAG: nitroreductase family protein [Candidatus Marinimicrobia bacterium]|nr:nitroreductase family protein [Candidatus Neomarinimicrobiota bacterium]
MSLSEELIKIIKTRRTIRQFRSEAIDQSVLIECIDCARVAPSARNLQPLEYCLVTEPELVAEIFPLLKWAGYIAPDGNPRDGQHPIGYLVVLVNKDLMQSRHANDAGAAIENFILAAWAHGIGTCWIASVERLKLRPLLEIPEKYEIDSVIAFGFPAESPVLETASEIRYWKDAEKVLHVPKKPMNTILHFNHWNRPERS